jgi:peroxiredoxin Q/BCP
MIQSMLYRMILRCALLCTTIASASPLPEPGSPAPEFKLQDQSNSSVSLSAYKGSWVILFFVGDHSSPDISLHARSLERDRNAYASFNAHVIGISRTAPEGNDDWARANQIDFPVLSDQDEKVAAAYGVPAGGSNSASAGIYEVIIAPDGRVKLPVIVTSDVDGQSDHLLTCLRYFQRQ